MSTLRILWILSAAGRAVLETDEGVRLDVPLNELVNDQEMIGRLNARDAFRLGYEAALFRRTQATVEAAAPHARAVSRSGGGKDRPT